MGSNHTAGRMKCHRWRKSQGTGGRKECWVTAIFLCHLLSAILPQTDHCSLCVYCSTEHDLIPKRSIKHCSNIFVFKLHMSNCRMHTNKLGEEAGNHFPLPLPPNKLSDYNKESSLWKRTVLRSEIKKITKKQIM